jgi:uncharacterized membrane protein YoaK (UPF0700 family)
MALIPTSNRLVSCSAVTARPKPSALPAALLLAATGGLLDAVVYLNHGHVFANAMTGNVIFLGISALSHDWTDVARHIAPILAFLIGIVAARLLAAAPIPHAAALTLVVEIVALFFIGMFPATLPQVAFTASVALVSAFQVTTFRRVGRFTYNSTYVTGNLREFAEGALESFTAPTPAARQLGRAKARKLALICLCFLAGATIGAFTARHYPTHAFWIAEPLLLSALTLILANPTHFYPKPTQPPDPTSIPSTHS